MGAEAPSMPGMTMGHAAGAPATLNLLPEWLGIVAAVMFILIAGSHLRHLATASGERRWWHVCHVLMAIGMAFMYIPAALDPFEISVQLWQALFAAVGIVVAFRVVAGVIGRASENPLWSLTAIALGTMVYMWASASFQPALTWLLVIYLAVEAGLWGINAYRAVDGGTPLISWTALAPAPDGPAVAVAADASGSLMAGLDISVSMTAMALGMAYMLAAMQLIS